jgi:hypothetical protein
VTELPPIDIQWEAPAECPGINAELAAIERLLGRPLDAARDGKVSAHGQVRRTEDGSWELHAVLEAGGHVESETMVAKRCQALGDAMALKIALAIDPFAPMSTPPPPPPPPTATATDVPAPTSSPAKIARERRAVHWGLRLAGGIGVGPLPGATPNVGLYGSLQLSRFRFELGGEAHWGGVARYDALPTVGADTSAFIGGARACFAPYSSAWGAAHVCAGLDGGVLHAQGFGLDTSTSATKPWGGSFIGSAVQLRLTARLSVWLEADGLLTVLKPEFYVRNLSTLYSPPTASMRAATGFEIFF